jgi:hypothetical protein
MTDRLSKKRQVLMFSLNKQKKRGKKIVMMKLKGTAAAIIVGGMTT